MTQNKAKLCKKLSNFSPKIGENRKKLVLEFLRIGTYIGRCVF
jgi:hypothetical protein